MEFQEFLVWLSGGLGASLVVSYLAERWAWFQYQLPSNKILLKTVAASVLAVVAYLVYTHVPVDFWSLIDPYWQIVLAVIATNYGVEVFHFFDKKLVE